ncbi:MAG: alpha-amylase family glycosyl hydrolase [marine benthic group bacterium]|nr:alpha-amylase family glycosyl hydrolase [Gemmatimonadota bacterium]
MHRISLRVLSMGLTCLVLSACGSGIGTRAVHRAPGVESLASDPSAFWNSATVYFLLTDRFFNGDPSNDLALGRPQDGAVLRSYMGGDLEGVLVKLEEGWFDSLGVSAIWMTPFLEQIQGSVDEGTGKTYAFHGYWTKDWTAVEPALGTVDDLRALVDAAHARGIRVILDAIINHTGPVTPLDPQWPDEWVRTGPRCAYDSYERTVPCTLVDNLPDIRTERSEPVELPPELLAKWEREGRLETEMAELDAWFDRTGYPRAPRYYLVKWLSDWVRELGFDGYRVDTARNFDEEAALDLKREGESAFADWRRANPEKVIDDLPFHMFGEVYGYDAESGREFDFGDRTVDYFDYGYDGLINFGLKNRDGRSTDQLFGRYSALLNGGALEGVSILSYISSHDDSAPWDPERESPFEAAVRLLLAPGGAQIYYGDELSRPLSVEGAEGDANLRSFMNWEDLGRGGETEAILAHWRKLARFRADHPAVGAGEHVRLSGSPWIFSRTLKRSGSEDRVLIAVGLEPGRVTVPVFGVFSEGVELEDSYTGDRTIVSEGEVTLVTESGIVLLGRPGADVP